MGLFKADLYKSFAIGFALGAALVAWQIAPQMTADQFVPPAHAATLESPAR